MQGQASLVVVPPSILPSWGWGLQCLFSLYFIQLLSLLSLFAPADSCSSMWRLVLVVFPIWDSGFVFNDLKLFVFNKENNYAWRSVFGPSVWWMCGLGSGGLRPGGGVDLFHPNAIFPEMDGWMVFKHKSSLAECSVQQYRTLFQKSFWKSSMEKSRTGFVNNSESACWIIERIFAICGEINPSVQDPWAGLQFIGSYAMAKLWTAPSPIKLFTFSPF